MATTDHCVGVAAMSLAVAECSRDQPDLDVNDAAGVWPRHGHVRAAERSGKLAVVQTASVAPSTASATSTS